MTSITTPHQLRWRIIGLILTMFLMTNTVNAQSETCVQWTLANVFPRSNHAMAYDSHRNVIVLYGGWAFRYRQTWEWDGTSWSLRASNGPDPHSYIAMAFDSKRGVTVLFGGTYDSPETWEWDGESWTLVSTTGPNGRYGYAMVFDEARGVTVLFGGVSEYSSQTFRDTWEWDGKTWMLRAKGGPPARWEHTMAYDSKRGVTVLVGGWKTRPYSEPTVYFDDTWEWDGYKWSLRSTFGNLQRIGHAMAYDENRGVTVLYGGFLSGYDAGIWEWDGKSWNLNVAAGPMPRRDHAMVYDSARKAIVLVGGSNGNMTFGDTWELDKNGWCQCADGGRPGKRSGHSMVYDSARDRVVLFGGDEHSYSGELVGDTWEWDGFNWLLRSISGPSPRAGHAMAYDSIRQVTVLYGGDGDNKTWEWNGDSWVSYKTKTHPPNSRAMSFDSHRGVCVLHGGSPAETWEWDGKNWMFRSAENPRTRGGHELAYDPVRKKTVLFGGNGFGSPYRDTWVWDGTSWTHVGFGGPLAPLDRLSYRMAFDDSLKKIVMTGGRSSAQNILNELWTWDGHEWTLIESEPGYRRASFGMAYDTKRNHFVYFGGDRDLYRAKTNDTWLMSIRTCGDVNNDGIVNILDLIALLDAWGTCPIGQPCPSDVNRDGQINVDDLLDLIRNWG